jgi:hypothetical protein
VKLTETAANTASTPRFGSFAVLCAALRARGRGAPGRGRRIRVSTASGRLMLSVFATTLGVLVFASAPALAAAPEAPELSVAQPVHPTEATFLGTLSPNASEPNKGGIYKFLYAAGTKCEGAKSTVAGLSLGAAHEELPGEPVTGLTPGTKYTVCLSITNLSSETTLSAPVSFTTPTVPEVPVTSTPAKSITTTTAILEGALNPTATAETGWYFLYSTEPTCSANASETTPVAPAPVPAKTKVQIEVKELQPHKNYEFCIVATNSAGEAVQSANEVSFETKALAPTVEAGSEHASGVSSTTANLEGEVNPNNEKTTAHLQYSTSATVNGSGALTTPTVLASQELGEGFGAQPVPGGELTGLPAGATFFLQVVATNATGTVYGPVESFTTLSVPATTAAAAITATTATFNGTLTPLNATVASEYSFNYRAGTECDGESATATESAGTGSGAKTVSTEATGLSPNTTYTVCLVSSSAFGSEQAAPVTFTTLIAAPAVESESSANIAATEARLEASINPGNSPTDWHFEYGTAAGGYEHSTPVQRLPAKLTAAAVNTVLTGLTPSTTYHYRLIASNALPESTVYGSDQTFTTTAAPETTKSGGCPNEKRREEQPYGTQLPDCRAYEMVSPANTNGVDAVQRELAYESRASVSDTEPAITYAALGGFAEGDGTWEQAQLLSRRTAAGWKTQLITPLQSEDGNGDSRTAFPTTIFTPELSEGLATSGAVLAPGAEEGNEDGAENLFVATFATSSYKYVAHLATQQNVSGASPDLHRIVFTSSGGAEPGAPAEEWAEGRDVPVTVTNNPHDPISGAVGSQAQRSKLGTQDTWHAVSSTGERVYFTSPGEGQGGGGRPEAVVTPAQLYVRTNVAAKEQSPLAEPEATAAGTLTRGSSKVTALLTAVGEVYGSTYGEGTTELGLVLKSGRFVVGEPLSGPEFAPGTTITAVTNGNLTLSKPLLAEISSGTVIDSDGPQPLAVGQRISGNGLAPGTTITAIAPGELTLSAPAEASDAAVPLAVGGECVEKTEACTTQVSASQRYLKSNPAGTRPARFWSASADGSKVFFTSAAELTEDAYTGSTTEQALTIKEERDEGAYQLSFEGQTTSPLPYDAGGGEVQSALESLSTIGPGNVDVAPGREGSSLLVTFIGTLAASQPPLLAVEGASAGVMVEVGTAHAAANLYEYDLETGLLSDLTPEATDSTGEGPDVQGVVQTSEDGAYVYFVAEGALASGATQGEANLYVVHDGGAPVFIATLPPADVSDWSGGSPVNTATVSPQGNWLAFLSNRGLPTGPSQSVYDTEQAAPRECEGEVRAFNRGGQGENKLCTEIYLYNAESASLVCASCHAGARPVGPATLNTSPDAFTQHPPRELLADGTLFFDSDDVLAQGATPSQENVYEYRDGQVAAISAVSGGYPSYFLDSSPSGENVFIGSTDRLLPEDPGGYSVVWDARVDGGVPVVSAAAPCASVEACEPPAAAPPPVGAPASATFSGPGNLLTSSPPAVVKPKPKSLTRAQKLANALKSCHKDKKRKKRVSCEKSAHKAYGAKAGAKRSSTARRAVNDRRADR